MLLAILPVSGAFAEGGADLRGADTYIVQPGDTLYNISTRTGVSVDTLVRVNHLTDADTIFVGSALRLRDQSGQNGSTVTTTVRSTQALAAALPGSVVAASVSTQAQVQAQMQAA